MKPLTDMPDDLKDETVAERLKRINPWYAWDKTAGTTAAQVRVDPGDQADQRTWVRRCRESGETELLCARTVAQRMDGIYHDVAKAMAAATKEMPLSNGIAEYWPEEGVAS